MNVIIIITLHECLHELRGRQNCANLSPKLQTIIRKVQLIHLELETKNRPR